MKKTTLTGFMASMFVATGAAFAAEGDTALTTKKYVDDGLRAVYGRASNTYTKSEADETFLKIEDANDLEYDGVQNGGVAVDNTNRTIKLDFGNATPETDTAYVYQNGVFTKLETVSAWSDSVLTQAASSSSSGSSGTGNP